MAEGRDTGSETGRIGGQAEITDSGEEIGLIAESTGIQPTPHTPKTDSDASRTGTEVGWCEHGYSGDGEIYGT